MYIFTALVGWRGSVYIIKFSKGMETDNRYYFQGKSVYASLLSMYFALAHSLLGTILRIIYAICGKRAT